MTFISSIADRDDYIKVLENNIEKGMQYSYRKCKRHCETYGVPYDCSSIMHYWYLVKYKYDCLHYNFSSGVVLLELVEE